MHQITVKPAVVDGWMVQCGHHHPNLFRSGAKAEHAAKDLARSLANAGHGAKITIYLRDGSIGGQFETPPT